MSIQRVAIVTGAAQGIGRDVAIRLAEDGFSIALCDLSSKIASLEEVATEIRTKGSKVIAVVADVSVEEQVETLVSTTVQELGGLDVMVANAGIALLKPFFETTIQEFQKCYEVNVLGVMLCFRTAAKAMVEQGRGGRLIAACSVAGKKGYPLMTTYSASKFAVRGLIQAAASELGQHGITVNGYAPGSVNTPMQKEVVMSPEVEEVVSSIVKNIALKRIAEPEDIANLVSFLASKDSGYITGQTICVDGGLYFD